MRPLKTFAAAILPAITACASINPADFTDNQKEDMRITAHFIQCVLLNTERIDAVHDHDKEYVMEFCATAIGFTGEEMIDLMTEINEKYGIQKKAALRALAKEAGDLNRPIPLIPNFSGLTIDPP